MMDNTLNQSAVKESSSLQARGWELRGPLPCRGAGPGLRLDRVEAGQLVAALRCGFGEFWGGYSHRVASPPSAAGAIWPEHSHNPAHPLGTGQHGPWP